MSEKSLVTENGLVNAPSDDTKLKAKKKFVEPLLTRHETLIENTLDEGGIGSTGVTGGIGGF
ncbi:hypothetical protein KJ068_20125 [bacterium]|nr:hypothetical protein [bacterium]RIK58729.1 MAG: hypothetical protein DCC62_29260 [candidate division KSB1 bacterium]